MIEPGAEERKQKNFQKISSVQLLKNPLPRSILSLKVIPYRSDVQESKK
jgi:hypothetical protein